MHDCETCGTACDCDGEDTWNPEPADHECINPGCGVVDDLSPEALDAAFADAMEKD
jgi:hypothetical protein